MSLVAGAAVRDISPTKPVQLCGYPHVRRISTGIHDPLLASALFLRNGEETVLLCALDLLMLNCHVARRMRRSVAEALKIAESRVQISCTHTHSGPVTLRFTAWTGDVALPDVESSYLEFVENRIVEAAVEAKQRAQPAELAWTSADARGVGGNRHFRDGPTDPDAGVLAVRAAGKLLAVTVIYGMHPTVLHEDSTLVSADFPYYARLHLQEHFGKELVVLYHTGPAGNQSPRYHVTAQTFAEAERLGRKLGAAVCSAIGSVAAGNRERLPYNANPVLAGLLQTVDFSRRQFPSTREAEKILADYRADYERLKAGGAERPQVRTAEVSVFGAEGLVRLAQAQERGEIDRWLDTLRPFEVQVMRVGEMCVAAFPGELFAEYGLELKKRADSKCFAVAYANGELQGYIVTPEAVEAGGYEAVRRMFEPRAGTLMIDTTVEMIRELNAQ